MFGGTKPDLSTGLYQNQNTGKNNIESATAAIYYINESNNGFYNDPTDWMENFVDFVPGFNESAEHIKVSFNIR